MSDTDIKVAYGFSKQRCQECHGLGNLPRGAEKGYFTSQSDGRSRPLCSVCSGHGYLIKPYKFVETGGDSGGS